VRFVVDSMHGSLARWLRILGHDVAYLRDLDDRSILARVGAGSVLLTSDVQLFRRAIARGLSAHLVKGKSPSERLSRLAAALTIDLEVDLKRSRCPECGDVLRSIEKSAAGSRVPRMTYARYDDFWECTGCRKVYWQGAHWKRIRQTLAKARSQVKSIATRPVRL